MANLFSSSAFDNDISLNDRIVIVGKDELKGLIGIVVKIKHTQGMPEPIYTVELEANGKKVRRRLSNLKRHFD